MPIKKVLVVDDSPTDQHYLRELLGKSGYEVTLASGAEEALSKAKSAPPDLILMDVVMPGLNGFQATRQLSRDPETQKIPVIMCTTKDQETDRVWGMRQGAVEYVVKPVVAEELLGKIVALG
jgi:twitching motility two-component system response regulator PilH